MILNRFQAVTRVNDLFVYEYDTVQYDAADYWRVLDVDAEKDEGDCEDYGVEKNSSLDAPQTLLYVFNTFVIRFYTALLCFYMILVRCIYKLK